MRIRDAAARHVGLRLAVGENSRVDVESGSRTWRHSIAAPNLAALDNWIPKAVPSNRVTSSGTRHAPGGKLNAAPVRSLVAHTRPVDNIRYVKLMSSSSFQVPRVVTKAIMPGEQVSHHPSLSFDPTASVVFISMLGWTFAGAMLCVAIRRSGL
jgi:hypothetical protein